MIYERKAEAEISEFNACKECRDRFWDYLEYKTLKYLYNQFEFALCRSCFDKIVSLKRGISSHSERNLFETRINL